MIWGVLGAIFPGYGFWLRVGERSGYGKRQREHWIDSQTNTLCVDYPAMGNTITLSTTAI